MIELIQNDEELLRFISLPVEKKDNVDEVIQQLEEVLKPEEKTNSVGTKSLVYKGYGCSAPQIGIYKRVCVIRIPERNGEVYKLNLVNPKIVSKDTCCIFQSEGCMSFPNQYCNTLRYKEIFVKDDLKPGGWALTGLVAIVIQHEIDHLDGIIFTDRKRQNIERNESCPCGSGKKAKKCCLGRGL